MKKIKSIVVALALVLSLSATIFAVRKLTTKTSTKTVAACCGDASCCAGGACKMNGACCGAHQTAQKQAKSGKALNIPVEDATAAATTASCHGTQTAASGKTESCCGQGAACCGTGAACCQAKTKSTAVARL